MVGFATGSEVFSTGVERVIDLASDSNNNYYFLAEVCAAQTDYDGSLIQTYSQDDNRKDIFMFSTDCQGNFRWSKSIGGGFDDRTNSIGVDADNNIYISGSTSNMGVSPPPNFANDTIKSSPLLDGSLEESRKSMFIIKYDEQGNFQWLREPEGPVDYFGAQLQKTIIEDYGRSHSLVRFGPGTHLEGQLTVTDPLGTSTIVIYNTNGDVEDFFEINMQPGFGWYDYQLAYDPNLDRYYLADTIRGSRSNVISINGFGVNSDNGFYLAALDNQGQVLWYHESTRTNSWTLGDIALDDNGDIYFTGEYNEGLNNELDSFAGYTFQADPTETAPKSPFLIKLDSSGNLI